MSDIKQRFTNGTKLYITKYALSAGIQEQAFRSSTDSADTEGVQSKYVYLKAEYGRNQFVLDRDIFADKHAALKQVLKQVERKKATLRKQQEKLDLLATRCKAGLDAKP